MRILTRIVVSITLGAAVLPPTAMSSGPLIGVDAISMQSKLDYDNGSET